jgi:hypothetical protein
VQNKQGQFVAPSLQTANEALSNVSFQKTIEFLLAIQHKVILSLVSLGYWSTEIILMLPKALL